MSLRTTLRTAVLTAVAAGTVLLPTAAAVADSTATPVPSASVATPAPAPTPTPTVSPDSEAAEPTEAPAAVEPGTMPRGGVDAGELPVEGTDDTALYGSAAGAVLLAGACALVLRRRSAAQRNG